MEMWFEQYYKFVKSKESFIKRFQGDPIRYKKAKQGLDVEFVCIQYFRMLYGEIEYPDSQIEKRDIDFIWRRKTFSVKADFQAYKTGNIAVEIDGWGKHSKADYFLFAVVKDIFEDPPFVVYDITPVLIERKKLLKMMPTLPITYINKKTRQINQQYRFRNYAKAHRIALLPISYTVPLLSVAPL